MTALLDERPVPPDGHPCPTGAAHQSVPDDDEALRDELATLAGHIAAATCRFLVLLGELDARGAWAGAGVLGPAHWLSYRCGMGEVAAREHVRVARALRRLPRTVAAFGAGRISYSKVRAITRVATPDNEDDLVALALSAPANHVERLVRGLRSAQRMEEVRDRHARRSLTWRWAEDGSLLLSGRFAPEDGARIVQVLEDVRHRADAEVAGAAPPPEDQPELVRAWGDRNGDGERAVVDPSVAARRSLADALVELCSTAALTDSPQTSRPVETVVHLTLQDLQQDDGPAESAVTPEGGDAGTRTEPSTAPEEPPADESSDSRGEDVPVRGRATTLAAPAPQSLLPTAGPRLEGGPRLHAAVARRLACDAGIVLQVHANGTGVSGRTLEVGARADGSIPCHPCPVPPRAFAGRPSRAWCRAAGVRRYRPSTPGRSPRDVAGSRSTSDMPPACCSGDGRPSVARTDRPGHPPVGPWTRTRGRQDE